MHEKLYMAVRTQKEFMDLGGAQANDLNEMWKKLRASVGYVCRIADEMSKIL